MAILSTRVHGMLDYGLGAVLLVAPALLGFGAEGAAAWVPRVIGLGVILYSLLTRYEFGAIRLIPMPVHLALDAVGGLVLALSPWLFGFAATVWLPHVILGLLEIGSSVVTSRVPALDQLASSEAG